MGFIKRKYNLAEDIRATQDRLKAIDARKELLSFPAWGEIENEFNGIIGRFTQEVFDLCKDPKKNHDEIRCKKMVANALGCIMTTIKNGVEQEDEIRKDLKDKQLLLHEQLNYKIVT